METDDDRKDNWETEAKCCYNDSLFREGELKTFDEVERDEEEEGFGRYVEGDYDFPLSELQLVSNILRTNSKRLSTNPVHCSLKKIHGCAKSHFRATRKTDTIMKIVAIVKTEIEAVLCPLFGESRRRRNATEHLVSHIVIK
jgi:hypothetical protein